MPEKLSSEKPLNCIQQLLHPYQHPDGQKEDSNGRWFMSALETISEGVILRSRSGEFLSWNKGAEEILKIPASHIIGQTSFERKLSVISEDGSVINEKDAPFNETLITGRPVRKRILGIYRSEDDLIWISVNTNPLYNNTEAEPCAVAISFSDITELKTRKDISRNYLDIAGVIIIAINDSGEITLINRKGCEILEGKEEDLLGKNWFDLFTPKEMLEEVKLFFRELMDNRIKNFNYTEYKIITLSGAEKIIAWNHTLLRDKDGKITGTLSSGEDITEKKRVEKELQRRAEFERMVSRISSDFVKLSLKDLDNGIYRALASIGKYSGADRAYLFLFHKDDGLADNTHEWCASGIEPQIDNLQGIAIEEELPWFDKIIRKHEVFEIPDVSALPPDAEAEQRLFEQENIKSLIVVPMVLEDRLIGFIGFDSVVRQKKWSGDDQTILRLVGEVFTNAIERKWSEEAIQESEKRWQFALEGAGDGVWDWSINTGQVYFSKKWKEMIGYSDDEIEGKLDDWDLRVYPDDRADVYSDLNAHFDRETEIYQNEHRVLCKDGSYKWILDRGKVIEWSEDGKPLRMIGIHSDISDRKKWELEREKLITELRDALDQIKTLSGLLPICANCKKIRDDKGYWNQIETYLHKHSHAKFSHSICPDCAKKLYPDFNLYHDENDE